MKKIRSAICLLLVLTLVFPVCAHGAEAVKDYMVESCMCVEVEPLMKYIRNISCHIDHKKNNLKILVNAELKSTRGEKCKLHLQVQRKEGERWNSLKSWNSEKNGASVMMAQDYAVSTKGTYRAKLVITVVNGKSTETRTIYSNLASVQ